MLFILAEKHQQEEAYASALKGRLIHRNRYLDEVDNSSVLPNHPKIQLSYLQGHAYELVDAKKYSPKWKSWALKYLPIFPLHFKYTMSPNFIKISGGKYHRNIINRAVSYSRGVWLGTDPDVEGEWLGYEYALINGFADKITGRIWVGSLTMNALAKTFHHIRNPKETRPRALAGHARANADWLIGINISRLITKIAEKYGFHGVFPAGRVQTPTIKLINDRRNDRENFKPTTTYRLAFLDKNGLSFLGNQVDGNGDVQPIKFNNIPGFNEFLLNTIQSEPSITSVQNKTRHQSAPKLPKTNDMEGYIVKHAHVSAKVASDKVLEPMYAKYKAQTYPRTECNLITVDDFNALKAKLPQYVDLYRKITGKKLSDALFTKMKPRKKFVDFTGKKVQKQGHGAITPNPDNKVMSIGQYKKLSKAEQVDYRYVLGCTLAMFADDHAYAQLKVNAESGQYRFSTSRRTDLPNATDWHQLFPNKSKKTSAKKPIPPNEYKPGHALEPNIKYTNTIPKATNGFYPKKETTSAPSAITESNLVDTVMPKYKLGTSSTRANIIANIKHSGLIVSASKKNKSDNLARGEFMPSKKGIVLLELMKYSHLLDLAKVASWEDEMKAITENKLSYHKFISDIKATIVDDIKRMPNADYHFTVKPRPKIKNFQMSSVGVKCPKCKKGVLQILKMDYPVKTGGYRPISFYGCSTRNCRFYCPTQVCDVKITPDVLNTIIKGDFPLRKIHNPKTGKTFPAKIVFAKGKVQFAFKTHKPKKVFKDIKCPKCKGHKFGFFTGVSKKYHKPYAYFKCLRKSCRFTQFQDFHGIKLDHDTFKKLCEQGLKQHVFVSYKKGTKYRADAYYHYGKFRLKNFQDF